MTASGIFERICADVFPATGAAPRYRTLTPSASIIPEHFHDRDTLYSIIAYGIDAANIAENKSYFIRDDFGELQFTNLEQERTDIIIGDGSLLTGYSYSADIDSDTYNAVKLVREDKEAGTRETWVESDDATAALWGRLQMVDSVDDEMNEAQIRELAQNLLRAKNREVRSLRLRSLGVRELTAGRGFILRIEPLGIEQRVWINSATHTYTTDSHTMDLEVYI